MRMRFFIILSFWAIALICLTWPLQAFADSATVEFETQALDLDTGTITEQAPDLLNNVEGADVFIGYHADRTPHAVVMRAGDGVALALLSGINYDSVTAADAYGLSFSEEAIDQAFEAADTVVVKTDMGATFKLGNAFEDDAGVTFSYELLQ